MKKLLLIRHAKAAAFGDEPGDHARPLAQRGQNQALVLGEQLRAANIFPELALVSSARRTQETWAGLCKHSAKANVKYMDVLYLASAEQIEQQIWLAAQEVDILAVIGHNPGIARLAFHWAAQGKGHNQAARQMIRSSYKPGFATYFEWNDSAPVLVDLFDPRKENL